MINQFFKFVILGLIILFIFGCKGESEFSGDTLTTSTSLDPQELTKNAKAKQAIGAYEEAIVELDRALKIDSKFIPAFYQKGSVYEEWDQRDKAIDSYNQVLKIDPNHEEARMGLGRVYSKLTMNDLAVKEFIKVAERKPNDIKLLFKIALEYWYIQKLPESVEYYKKVLALDPQHLQAHLNIASVYERMKDYDLAIAHIGTAIKLGKAANDKQAVRIAQNKLGFLEGRKDMTEKDLRRKTMPPFK